MSTLQISEKTPHFLAFVLELYLYWSNAAASNMTVQHSSRLITLHQEQAASEMH